MIADAATADELRVRHNRQNDHNPVEHRLGGVVSFTEPSRNASARAIVGRGRAEHNRHVEHDARVGYHAHDEHNVRRGYNRAYRVYFRPFIEMPAASTIAFSVLINAIASANLSIPP
ncbi:MAG: hypothetical protein QM775_06600 [Pirellulales bacterium]